ncbi:unnamed protein product [Rhodiola kirilowii]
MEVICGISNKGFKYTADFVWLCLVATCVKLLLVPSYRSTDFEVHRHWAALTHSLPLSEWYLDETSPWTLDYPPFFAYFERFISVFAYLVDPKIVQLREGLNYASLSVIYFQRVTVILSDVCLFAAVYRLTRRLDYVRRFVVWILIIGSPGLLIVDHIHFQYNGFLLGLLLLSLSFLEEGRDLEGGFFFAALLCFKHLFAVAAPVYFVYLLRHYCRGGLVRGFSRLLAMGAVVASVIALAFGPFLYHGQIHQLIRRLFPFGRGLCHAYWAPNFWALYIMFDKGLAFSIRKLGFSVPTPEASFTGGLVGDASPFSVLPQVTPLATFILVLLSIAPCLVKAWKHPHPRMITRWVVYAYTCGFLFGWHVHEKASLHFLIPLALVSTDSMEDAKHYFITSIVSCYSLFPLLFEAQEYPIKVLLLLLHSLLMWIGFSTLFPESAERKKPTSTNKGDSKSATKKRDFDIGCVWKVYLLGLLAVEVWGQFLHPYIFKDKLPFLPLMMVSIYSTFGMMYSWIWQLKQIIKSS